MKIALALAALAAVTLADEPRSTDDCEDELQINLLDSTQSQPERCVHLVDYSKCLGRFPAEVALEAKLAKLQQVAKCGGVFTSSTPPQIVTDDNSLQITVDHSKEATFHRNRRETVSVFDLDDTVAELQGKLTTESGLRLTADQLADKQIKAAMQEVKDADKEGKDARDALTTTLTTANAKLETDTATTLKATGDALDASIKAVEKAIADQLKVDTKATDVKLAASKAAADEIVKGVSSAVPGLSCANKKKDGTETDEDCGGPDCDKCKKGKKCQFSSDCDASMCISGVCNTCASKRDAKITIAPGVEAFCVKGRTQPKRDQSYIEFTTCGHTGPYPPNMNDCMFEYSLDQPAHSLQMTRDFFDMHHGFQVFTAPVDGNYKWFVHGAKGGTDMECCGGHDYNRHGKGGDGGRVVATQKNVKAGTKFYMRVGQRGQDCISTHNDYDTGNLGRVSCPKGSWHVSTRGRYETNHGRGLGFNACGGFNGGGPTRCLNNPGGASGGGGTDIRQCKMGEGCTTPPGWDKRFLVGGGGGGGACEGNDGHGCGGYARWGGHGGADSAEHGYDNGYNGYGGTQSAGGNFQSGRSENGATRGLLGQGGTGGRDDAGGGGGGYYGGGGADHNAGGGGGSNFYQGTSFSGAKATGAIQVHNNDRGQNRGEGYIRLEIYG